MLTVTADGRFTFTMDVRMSMPGEAAPSGQLPGIPNMNLDCGGTIEPAGDHFTLRSSTGQCGTFDAKLSADDRTIDLFLQGGSSTGSLSLNKAG